MSSALMMMTSHEASDMPSKSSATLLVTQSPWFQTLMSPMDVSMLYYSKTKLIGTLNHMASATPPRLPGT